MSLTLNLGVVDVPYSMAPTKDGGEGKGAFVTTGDVAGFLENKYHVMEIFYEERQKQIAEALSASLAGALENALAGGPVDSPTPFAEAESAIGEDFRQFITLGVMETLGYPGVPTKAALAGVNHRLKKKKGEPRPSFVDTSLYMTSMRAWVE